jgi:gas vesicle protein
MGSEEARGGCGSMILAFFIGGVVGAGVALLFAPRPGEQTRERITGVVEEAKEKAATCLGGIKEKVATVLEKGRDVVQEKKTIISSAIDACKDAYEKEKEKLSKA